MFKLEIKKETLKSVLGALSAVNNDVMIKLEKDQLSCEAVDKGHVMMGSLKLDQLAFESYESSGEELPIDIKKLSEFVAMAPKESLIKIEKIPRKNLISVGLSFIKREMGLLDPLKINNPKIPNFKLDSSCTPIIDDLILTLKAADMISESVKLGLTKKGLRITSQGTVDNIDAMIPSDILKEINIKNGGGKAEFSIEKLDDILKALPGGRTELFLGVDVPLKIEYTTDHMEGFFMLAPRVDDGNTATPDPENDTEEEETTEEEPSILPPETKVEDPNEELEPDDIPFEDDE